MPQQELLHSRMRFLVEVVEPGMRLDLYGSLYDERYHLVLLEAMASGTAVAGRRVASIPEIIVERVTGYVVPPNDPQARREALRRVYDDPVHVRCLGERERELVRERFTWGAIYLGSGRQALPSSL